MHSCMCFICMCVCVIHTSFVCSAFMSCTCLYCVCTCMCTRMHAYICLCAHICVMHAYVSLISHTCVYAFLNARVYIGMRWLQLVGSLKLQVSFAEYRLFHRALLQKRPVILRSPLIVATPYMSPACRTFIAGTVPRNKVRSTGLR